MSEYEGPESIRMLNEADGKDRRNLAEAAQIDEARKEKLFASRANQLEKLKEDLFARLSGLDRTKFGNEDDRQALFTEFSNLITEMFPEIDLFTEPGAKATQSSPKPAEVEHRKTVASIYYLLLLTSSEAPITAQDDVRFRVLVPLKFQDSLDPRVLEEQRLLLQRCVGNKEKTLVMASMLAIHDVTKLQRVEDVVDSIRSKRGEDHTSDHDAAMQSLLEDQKAVKELLPTMANLPKRIQVLMKRVMGAGSKINLGQIGQGLEGNPSQIAAILQEDLTEEEMDYWISESLADTATAFGAEDGSAELMSQTHIWNAWNWAVSSLEEVKRQNNNPVEAYKNMLYREARALSVGFDRENEREIVALRICMALQTTDRQVYAEVLAFVQNTPGKLLDVFGMKGMTGDQTYRLYYAPAILRKVQAVVGTEKALTFLNRITSVCQAEVKKNPKLQRGEITFQLSPLEKAIPKNMQQEALETLTEKTLVVDEKLYVAFQN